MPRPYKALREQGYKHYFTALTGGIHVAIIHSKTSFVGYRGRGVPRPYKALRRQGYKHHLLPLQGAHVLHILRLFIPKHPCRLSRARRASPLQSLAEARLCKEVCFLFFGCFAEKAQGVGGAVVFGEGVDVSPHYVS